jgi:uncharacterized protein (TIGR02118 family)
MIKVIGLLSRKPGISHEEFVKHWVEIHAPMSKTIPGLRRYSLNHVLDEPTRPDVAALIQVGLVDGIAELWYDDMEAYKNAKSCPEGQVWLADGATFIGSAKTFVLEDQVIIA